MVVAFKIVLLITILIAVVGAVGEKDDKKLQSICTAVCITAIAAFVVSQIYL